MLWRPPIGGRDSPPPGRPRDQQHRRSCPHHAGRPSANWRQSARVALKLIPQDDGSTRMEIDGRVQKPMPPQMVDLDLRLRDMDAYQVAR